MRTGLAPIAVFAAAGLWAGQMPSHAQQPADATASLHVQDQSHCPGSFSSSDAQPSRPEVSIDSVTFSGFLQMPVSEQDEIAASIKREAHGDVPDGVIDEALERVRAGWQNHGYFKVHVSGDSSALAKNSGKQHIALFIHVDEGPQYKLGGITFKNNRAITNVEHLRGLFPIHDGDIFSREKIAKGLENIRKVYGEYGFVNYTGVPATTFDDRKKLAFLEIDVDEGKQFYVSINVEGLPESARQELLNRLPLKSGDVYNGRLWERSLRESASLFPRCECPSAVAKRLDEQTRTVTFTLDFRPCSAN